MGMVLLGWLAGVLFDGSSCYLHAQTQPQSPSQANKAGPTVSPVPEQPREPAHQPSAGQSHGDVWIIGAEVGVAIGTLLLVWVTRIHVNHFKRLVERIERLYELQSSSRIAVSLVDDQNSRPWICVQNIGQVPVAISELRFLVSDPRVEGETLPTEASEIRHSWVLPGEKRMVQAAALASLWSVGSAESVVIECSYFDAYPEKGKNRTVRKLATVWELDHGRKYITLRTEN